jgi:nicotinamidase-related amidase
VKRALVVVDMIEDFVHEGGALYCGPSMQRIVPVIQRELARARSAGELVVYLTDNHLPDDAEFEIFPRHAIIGTKGAAIVPEVAAGPGDVDITLRERGVDTIRLVGDCTNICVLYTAADARNLGYAVEVVAEGVTSFDEEAHRDALRELEKTLGATILHA